MSKIRLTKNELKFQRDALKRFARYLPTLQLKKQQVQVEVRRTREAMAQLEADQAAFAARLATWVQLFADAEAAQLGGLLAVARWDVGTRNIAGIETPTLVALTFDRKPYDLFATPLWFDEALTALQALVDFRLRRVLLEEQLAQLEQELRIVTQRVNLFEKVKIPEARENIRRIQIYLGDQQTNAVGRAKIAKEKSQVLEAVVAAS